VNTDEAAAVAAKQNRHERRAQLGVDNVEWYAGLAFHNGASKSAVIAAVEQAHRAAADTRVALTEAGRLAVA
jgi:hypothetical protein